jgi:ribosome-binding factor A
LNAEKELPAAQAGLDSAKGFIKRELGGRLELRYFPEIRFMHDHSLETADRMENLLKGLKIPEGDENR